MSRWKLLPNGPTFPNLRFAPWQQGDRAAEHLCRIESNEIWKADPHWLSSGDSVTDVHELYASVNRLSPSVAEDILEQAARDWPRIQGLEKGPIAVWMFKALEKLPAFLELPEFVQLKIKSELINVFAHANAPNARQKRRP